MRKTFEVEWKCHLPNLMKEVIENNPDMGVLYIPVNLMMGMIDQVAQRAAKINDPILNELMCRLTLYEQADPSSKDYDPEMIKMVESMADAQRKSEKRLTEENMTK